MESLGSVPARPLPYEGVWRFTAPSVEISVPRARHAVRDLLRRRRAPVSEELVRGLLLIVSELVTNAVRHAVLLSPELGVEVGITADWIRVSVEDGHPYRPKALERDVERGHAQTGGRGLLLVREITEEAGGTCDVERTASGGKIVWALLPLTPGAVVPPLGEAHEAPVAPHEAPAVKAASVAQAAQAGRGERAAQGVHGPRAGVTSPRPTPSAP